MALAGVERVLQGSFRGVEVKAREEIIELIDKELESERSQIKTAKGKIAYCMGCIDTLVSLREWLFEDEDIDELPAQQAEG